LRYLRQNLSHCQHFPPPPPVIVIVVVVVPLLLQPENRFKALPVGLLHHPLYRRRPLLVRHLLLFRRFQLCQLLDQGLFLRHRQTIKQIKLPNYYVPIECEQ
jgi:hypothetical protein